MRHRNRLKHFQYVQPAPFRRPASSNHGTNQIGLSEREQMQMRDLEAQVIAAKVMVAEKYTELMAAADLLAQRQKELVNAAVGIAQAYGIDTADPAKGRWDLDTKAMVFNRVG